MIQDERICLNKLDFDISYMSEQGGRPVNEDSIAVEHNKQGLLLSVADGLGAHGGGDVASKIATHIVSTKYLETGKANFKNIIGIFEDINTAIIESQTEEIQMKTTLACAFIDGKWIHLAHVGDTRIYIFKNNKDTYITVDHSAAYEEMMKNHGTLNDIREYPNRHILRAALGVRKIRPPDIFRQRLKSDLSILICSDGFWEYVNEDEMLETLNATSSSHRWLQEMLELHSKKASVLNDNYTAISLRIIKNQRRKNPCNSKV